MKHTATVVVYLRQDISDPQGRIIERSMPAMGFTNVSAMRAGKQFTFELDANDLAQAESQVDAIARDLLSNPVLESYTFSVHKP